MSIIEKGNHWVKKNPFKFLFLGIIFIGFSIKIGASIGSTFARDGSKIVGTYTHSISRNMDGNNISASTQLTIRKDGPGDYKYQIIVNTVDDMYGGVTKLMTNSSGRLNSEEVKNNEWKFEGGDLGERGAYIMIPENGWTSPPSYITVNFASGRGISMEFKRY